MSHLCHAHACGKKVPPTRLFCAKHWAIVPKPFQRLVWDAYRPGQEQDKAPSDRYMAIQRMVVAIVAVAELYTEEANRYSDEAKQWSIKAGNTREIALAMEVSSVEFKQIVARMYPSAPDLDN